MGGGGWCGGWVDQHRGAVEREQGAGVLGEREEGAGGAWAAACGKLCRSRHPKGTRPRHREHAAVPWVTFMSVRTHRLHAWLRRHCIVLHAWARGRQGTWQHPPMVYVLPLEVWPYASTAQLMPLHTLRHSGRMYCSHM